MAHLYTLGPKIAGLEKSAIPSTQHPWSHLLIITGLLPDPSWTHPFGRQGLKAIHCSCSRELQYCQAHLPLAVPTSSTSLSEKYNWGILGHWDTEGHKSHYAWHVPCDMWHDVGRVNILPKLQLPSSYGLGGKVNWRFGGKEWLNK